MAYNSIVDYCNYTTRNGEQSLGIFNSQKCTVFEIQAFKVEKYALRMKMKIWRISY